MSCNEKSIKTNSLITNYDTVILSFKDKKYKNLLNSRQLIKQKTFYNLAEAIQCKENVYKLNLRSKNLDTFPTEICSMLNLQELYLDSNSISYFPSELAYLKNLQILSISSNTIKKLTSKIGYLDNLKYLNLSVNELDTIPTEIIELHKLEYLNLYWNREIRTLPEKFGNLKRLKEFHFTCFPRNDNSIPDVLLKLCFCDSLEILSLKCSRAYKITREIGCLKNLKQLDLSLTKIRDLPYEICYLTKLEKLNISMNNILIVPNQVYLLTNLQELNMSNQWIQCISSDLKKLEKLNSLDLSFTAIGSDEFERLKKEYPKINIKYCWINK